MDDSSLTTGVLADGSTWIRAGRGPDLVLSLGLVPESGQLRGLWRRMTLSTVRAYADRFTVWAITRPTPLGPDTTMSDLARSLTDAIGGLTRGPVNLIGFSTGAAVAIEAAARWPDTVQQLVVADGACRLSELGRTAQSRLADDLERGRQRRGWIRFLRTTDGPVPGTATGVLGSILPGALVARDTRDVVATLRAEGAWDAEARLGSITARTLLVGGQDDCLYGPEPMRVTASGIRECSPHILPAKGHGVATTRTGTRIIRDFL